VVIWQVFAGVVAFALVATAVLRLRKSRRPSQILFVLLLVPIPAAGFALYAVKPGPLPTVTLATWVGSMLLALAIYPAFWWRRAAELRRASPLSFKDVAYINRHSLAWRGCAVLGVTVYLFMFEPWFALANLSAIAAWVALWIPTGRRRRGFEVSAEVRAVAEATVGFLVEPSNWSRYRSDIEAVTWKPDGPPAVGTEVTVRRAIPRIGREEMVWPGSINERLRITRITGTSFTAVMLGRKATVTTDVRSSGSATRITGKSEWIIPFVDAILGLVLEETAAIEAARQSMLQSYERLDGLIGAPLR
jgi:hypothetical protein